MVQASDLREPCLPCVKQGLLAALHGCSEGVRSLPHASQSHPEMQAAPVCPVGILTAELTCRAAGFSGGCPWCVFTRCFLTVPPRTGGCDFGAHNPRDTVFCKDWVNPRAGWPFPKVSLSVCIKSLQAGWSGTYLRWCGHSPSVNGTFCFCALVMGCAGGEKQASLPDSGH